jgi:hypothetical protein
MSGRCRIEVGVSSMEYGRGGDERGGGMGRAVIAIAAVRDRRREVIGS